MGQGLCLRVGVLPWNRGSTMGPVALGSAMDGGSTMEQGLCHGWGRALLWGGGLCHGVRGHAMGQRLSYGPGLCHGAAQGDAGTPGAVQRGTSCSTALTSSSTLKGQSRSEMQMLVSGKQQEALSREEEGPIWSLRSAARREDGREHPGGAGRVGAAHSCRASHHQAGKVGLT